MPRRLLNGAGGQGLREAARPSWKLWAAQWPSDWGPGGLGVSPWGGPGEVGTSSGPRARSRARPVWAVGAGPAVRTRGSPLGDTLGPLRLRFPGRAGPCPRTHGPPPPVRVGPIRVPAGAQGAQAHPHGSGLPGQPELQGPPRACPPLQASVSPQEQHVPSSLSSSQQAGQVPGGPRPAPTVPRGGPGTLPGTPPPRLPRSPQVRTLSQGGGAGAQGAHLLTAVPSPPAPGAHPGSQAPDHAGASESSRMGCLREQGTDGDPDFRGERQLGPRGRRGPGSHAAEPPRGSPEPSPAPAWGSGRCQARAGRGSGRGRPGASPARTAHLGGGAGATITGKAKAVVSLLGKYLQKPQEAAGGGPSRSPRPGHSGGTGTRPSERPAPPAARLGPAPSPTPLSVVRGIGCTPSVSAPLPDGPLQPSRV